MAGEDDNVASRRLASCGASASALACVGLSSASVGRSHGEDGARGCSEGGDWAAGAGLDTASDTAGGRLGSAASDDTVGAAAVPTLAPALAADAAGIPQPLLADPSNDTTVSTGKSIHPNNNRTRNQKFNSLITT